MPQELNFNIYNILIISGIIQGFLFGIVVLFSKKYRSTPNKYLAQAVIYLSLNNLYFWLTDTNISNSYIDYEYLNIPWSLLVMPMFYFFVVSYLNLHSSKRKRLLLKLPFVMSLFVHFIFIIHKLLFSDYFVVSDAIRYGFYNGQEYFSIFFSLFLIYTILKILRQYEKLHFKYNASQIFVSTKWLKQLLYFGLIVCLFWFLLMTASSSKINLFGSSSKYLLWLSVSVAIYWLGYVGIFHASVFNQRKNIRATNMKAPGNSEKSNLKSGTFEKINATIQDNKMYLDPQLSLDVVSTATGLSTGYISQLVNEFSNANFSNYINKLRVAQAKELLISDAFNNYTIISIALESGFNSKSAFYQAFQKEIGMTPKEYRASMLS